MRFDDSLTTVLSADRQTGNGAAAAWRQLVDLVGRGRAPADEPTIAELARLRGVVPPPIRAASGRALAYTRPPRALVAFFADDDLAIAAPVLRTATLDADDWHALLPSLGPAQRSVLRQRRDLPAATVRALDSFGAVDFRLPDERGDAAPPDVASPPAVAAPVAPPDTPLGPSPFVALGEVPIIAAARAQAEEAAPVPPAPRFEIADLVARIDQFNRDRPEAPAPTPLPGSRFATDADGTIDAADGSLRGALIGASLASVRPQGRLAFEAGIAGAWRHRDTIRDARVTVSGDNDGGGNWRLSAEPVFDPASGRFVGYRGELRRPRYDEAPAPLTSRVSGSEQLRQLVHELRTPANAIAGFAELIGSQLLGPVPEPYLDRARAIHARAGALVGAIDDLDTAARIEGGALDLRDETVAIGPLIDRLAADLAPLGSLRRARLAITPIGNAAVRADARATERLIGRLLAAALGAAAPGEAIGVDVRAGREQVAVTVDRPAMLAAADGDALFAIDDAPPEPGAPLLGTGFALRLVRNLAAELGGVLAIGPARLTLRLPAASARPMEQAQTN